ncbi:MAG: SbcC/MukB-like Walker B domain-containing protein [Caldilineaceae bacterium]
MRQQETDLKIAIAGDATGRQLQTLTQEMSYAGQEVKRRQSLAQQYDDLARAFDLPPYSDETTFYQTRRRAEALKPALEQRLQRADESLGRLHIEQNQVHDQWQSSTAELASLNARQSQIPSQNLTLRRQILDALQIPESDVPFVGELLRVREKERAWEGAVERLLHNFGLRLLVPETHYPRVSRYVNQTNLRGRIVFHRVALDASYAPPRAIAENALIHKLQIKPDTPYYGWIEHEIQHQFDYLCCESMSDFDRAAKAITLTGLTKSGGSRHEKDDRRDLHDRRSYILGWTNADKIRAIEQEVAALEEQHQALGKALEEARRQQRNLHTLGQRLENLRGFDSFAAIDWHTTASQLRDLADQKARLEQSSNRLQQLQSELHQVQEKVTAEEQALRTVVKTSGQVEHLRQQYQRELYECQRELEQRRQASLDKVSAQIEQLLKVTLTLVNINSERRQIEEYYRQARSTAERRRNTHMGTLIKAMQEYKSTYPEETADFDATVNAIPEFERELLRIRQDDLPRYRERFKSLLNEKVIENIALLHGDLYRYQEEIEESVATLNASLHTINYTADTYIQLQTEPSRDVEIRAFKQELQACLPDVGRQQQEEDYEASFRRIQALITKFKEDARWTDKVTDVRQWLDFAATERYRADDSLKEYYSDSAGKSGGQKAKLAYTILASAIAYQYGLKAGETQSGAFRFVVVDEAFSRSDQENSRYAMALFKELELQLLVVTPMTGIHIVEPYIAACHFVFNNSEGNHSQIETMTVQQLRAQRLAFQNGGMPNGVPSSTYAPG